MPASIGHNSCASGNWIAVSRDMRDHAIVGFGRPVRPADPKKGSYSRAEAWIDLIMEARWQPGKVENKGKVILLNRGQLMAARKWLADRWNWTENTVRTFLDKLEHDLMISRKNHQQTGQKKNNQISVVTIENYDIFQTASELMALMDTTKTTSEPPANHQQATSEPPESNKGTKKQGNKEYNNHPSLETAMGVGEIQGLNGATHHIVKTLGEWINPLMPDHRTAKGWLESSIGMYGGTVVRDSFAELEAKLMHGDVVARPIPLLTKICQRRVSEKPNGSNASEMTAKSMMEKYEKHYQGVL